MSLTHEDVQKILAILDGSDYEEVSFEFGDIKLHLRRHGNSWTGQDEGQAQDRGDAQGSHATRNETPHHAAVDPPPGRDSGSY